MSQSIDKKPKILTRINIDADGNLTVTDLWQEVEALLGPSFTAEIDGQACEWNQEAESTSENH